MPFQTGSAPNPASLVATIQSFCVANGFTLSGNVLSKGNLNAEILVVGDNISIQGGLGESGGALVDPAPGLGYIEAYEPHGDLLNNWPVTYRLFAMTNPDAIWCVIQYNVNWIQLLVITDIDKKGTWTGGEIYAASRAINAPTNFSLTFTWDEILRSYDSSSYAPFFGGQQTRYGDLHSSMIHIEADGHTWGSDHVSASSSLAVIQHAGSMAELIQASLNTWNDEPTLVPYYLFMDRPSNYLSLIGEIPHMRSVRIDNHNPGDIIPEGSDYWMVFPWVRKGIYGEAWTSGPIGFALKYDGPI